MRSVEVRRRWWFWLVIPAIALARVALGEEKAKALAYRAMQYRIDGGPWTDFPPLGRIG